MIEKKVFIGKKVKIKFNENTFSGTIIDETKNTLLLEKENKVIRIIKKNSTITLNGKTIDSKKIIKRPEDRIKA